jgi:hypothetical protein
LSPLLPATSEIDPPRQPALILPSERNDRIHVGSELLREGGLGGNRPATPGLWIADLEVEVLAVEAIDQLIRKGLELLRVLHRGVEHAIQLVVGE